MGSLAVVFVCVFGGYKLLRLLTRAVHSACDELERWYHQLDDRSREPLPTVSPIPAGIHTRVQVQRLARDMLAVGGPEALDADRDPVASCLFVGPRNAGQPQVAKAMAVAVGLPMEQFNIGSLRNDQQVTQFLGSSGRFGTLSQSLLRSGPRLCLFLEDVVVAHPGIREVLLEILETGAFRDALGQRFNLHGSLLVMTSTTPSDFMESVCDLSPREIRERLSRRLEWTEICNGAILSKVHTILPFCYPSDEVLRTIISERLTIALRFMGQSRLRFGQEVVEAFANTLHQAGYPLIDIDNLIYEFLARAVEEAFPRRRWRHPWQRGRLIVVEDSPIRIASLAG